MKQLHLAFVCRTWSLSLYDIKLLMLMFYCTFWIFISVYRLKSLSDGKVWSSSAPNLGKSPKHAPMTAGFSSLNEMGGSGLFILSQCQSFKYQPQLTFFIILLSFTLSQRSAVSSKSHQAPYSPQTRAVTGLLRTRGPCGAAWGTARCLLLGCLMQALLKGQVVWGLGSATRTRCGAAARGRRVTCCC